VWLSGNFQAVLLFGLELAAYALTFLWVFYVNQVNMVRQS